MARLRKASRLLGTSVVVAVVLLVAGCPRETPTPDTTAPTVESVQPAADATGVAPGTVVTVTFSEAMATDTVSDASVGLSTGGDPVAGSVAYADQVATFTPDEDLEYETTYTATVTTDVTDTAGNALAEAYTWSFTTAAEPDTTAPAVTGSVPAADATGVALDTAISVTFSEAVNVATLAGNVVLSAGGFEVPGSFSLDEAGTTATFTPAVGTDLPLLTAFTLTVSADVEDLSGNPLATAFSASFATRDGAWGTPATIGAADGLLDIDPQVAFDAAGEAWAVWAKEYSSYQPHANRYSFADSAWAGETPVFSTAVEYDYSNVPDIASNHRVLAFAAAGDTAGFPYGGFDGTSFAAWKGGGYYADIYGGRSAAGGAWSDEQLLSPETSQDSEDPWVAASAQGEGLLVWNHLGEDWSTREILSSRFGPSTEAWDAASIAISAARDSAAGLGSPQAAYDPSGNAVAVWQENYEYAGVTANRYDASSGEWLGYRQIDGGSRDAYSPQVVCDRFGNATVVYICTVGESGYLAANRYAADTTWSDWDGTSEVDLTSDEGYFVGGVRAQCVLNGDVLVMAVAQNSTTYEYDVFALRYTYAAQSWEDPIHVGTAENMEVPKREMAFAADLSGNALYVWLDGGQSLWVSRFDSTGGWVSEAFSTPVELASAALEGYLYRVDADAGPLGRMVVAWSEDTGTGIQDTVRAAAFE